MHDVGRQRRLRRQECRVAVAAQQEVELVQLAALALPAHPAAFRLVVEAAPVQQVEALAAGQRVALVEQLDLAARIVEHLAVAGRQFDRAVRPVGQQREMDVADHVGEEMHLEIAQALVDVVARADQRGNHDQRARLGRHAVLEFVADQAGRRQRDQHQLVEQAEARLHRRQHEQHQHDGDRRAGQADIAERRRDHGQQDRGDCGGRADDARPSRPCDRRA